MDTEQMEATQPTTRQRGAIVWFDMQFGDVNRAKDFYADLFDWQFTKMEGLEPPYYMVNTGEGSTGGGFSQRPEGEPKSSGTPDCLLYMGVPHVANIIARATEMGASVVIRPDLIPDGSGMCFAWLKDPEGVVFGIVGPADTM